MRGPVSLSKAVFLPMAADSSLIYLDNHATTRCDPRVVDAMIPYLVDEYGNAGSVNHSFGHRAKDAVEDARKRIARAIGAEPREVIFTSGATESNNLALRGTAARRAGKGRHIISVQTEHSSVLGPLRELAEHGFEVTLLPVQAAPKPDAGLLDPDRLDEAIRADTILVSVMLANNEIGAIQPLALLAGRCRERGVLLHTDATQALGKIPFEVDALGVDLLSASAHKIYGPKGVGMLYVRGGANPRRLEPMIHGGGQENHLRSGTLNVPGIVGFATALDLCLAEMPEESERLRQLRQRLFDHFSRLPGVALNGPSLERPQMRLPGNLNLSFSRVDGETLMLLVPQVAVSSGAACSSSEPDPSHVLQSLGLSAEAVRSSIRFGLGRFTTADEIDQAADLFRAAIERLRRVAGD